MIGRRPSPTRSNSQRQGASFHGSPVEPNTRRLASAPAAGSPASPSPISRRASVGDSPRWVRRWRSTSCHRRSGRGWSGVPSNSISAAPRSSAPKTSQGPIIQPMSVIQPMRSPALTSKAIIMSCAAFSGKPAWVWSTPFGRPVVPEVYRIISGASAACGAAPAWGALRATSCR